MTKRPLVEYEAQAFSWVYWDESGGGDWVLDGSYQFLSSPVLRVHGPGVWDGHVLNSSFCRDFDKAVGPSRKFYAWRIYRVLCDGSRELALFSHVTSDGEGWRVFSTSGRYGSHDVYDIRGLF